MGEWCQSEQKVYAQRPLRHRSAWSPLVEVSAALSTPFATLVARTVHHSPPRAGRLTPGSDSRSASPTLSASPSPYPPRPTGRGGFQAGCRAFPTSPNTRRNRTPRLARTTHLPVEFRRPVANDERSEDLSALGRSDRPVAVDLFSGCGGLTTGLRSAGFRVAVAIEIDPLAVKTYTTNHRDVTVYTMDIRDLRPEQLDEPLQGIGRSVDLLAGCPPCQGFSKLRTLNGALRLNDPRNSLLWDFYRLVELLQPRAIMLENVPGLAHDEHFSLVCRQLNDLGYIGEHRVLNAADYSVPQRRLRLIYLAGYGFPIPFAKKTGAVRTVKDALSRLPKAGQSGDRVHDLPERHGTKVRRIIRHIPKDGGSRADLPHDLQLDCHKRCNGFSDVYGRMAWNRVAPTITSGCFNPSKGRFLHPEADRAITMREAALLQGFPPDYEFAPESGKEALATMIGNALPPPFIAAHGKCVRQALKDNPAVEYPAGK